MMSESLVEYSALRVMEKKYSAQSVRKFLGHELDDPHYAGEKGPGRQQWR